MRSLKKLSNQQGYLLLEVLIASIILSVGIVALLQSLSRSLEVARYAKNHAVAVTLLEDSMTELEAEVLGYDLNVPEDSLSTKEGFNVEFETITGDGPLSETRVIVVWREHDRTVRCDAGMLLFSGAHLDDTGER